MSVPAPARSAITPQDPATAGLPSPHARRGSSTGAVHVAHLGPMRIVVRPRSLAVVGIALVATAIAAIVSLGVGEVAIPSSEVLTALVGTADPQTELFVAELRAPRVACAVLVGAALGLSGALFQALTRNPLGSPDVVGLTGGAALAAVTAVVAGAGATVVGIAAIGGGLAAAALVYGLAWRGGLSPGRLVLVGVGVAAACAALVQWLIAGAQLTDAQTATLWLTGSLNGRTWAEALTVGVALGASFPLALVVARPLALLELGDDLARGLGVDAHRVRLTAVLIGCVLAGAATAAAGPLAFVALVAPQLARLAARTSSPPVVASAAVGAALVAFADLVSRLALDGVELPAGVVTAAIGGPLLVWLLARGRELA